VKVTESSFTVDVENYVKELFPNTWIYRLKKKLDIISIILLFIDCYLLFKLQDTSKPYPFFPLTILGRKRVEEEQVISEEIKGLFAGS